MEKLTKIQRSKIMKSIHSTNTRPEILFRKALWSHGIRYRKNYKDLPGSPDIAITRYHIAIFIDGDFWHARNHLKNPGEQIKNNKSFWITKLKNNVERDKAANDALTEMGWIVLRFWSSDIESHLDDCVKKVLNFMGRYQ
jgi:DNA mismatch endonuclease (patch repair protein)